MHEVILTLFGARDAAHKLHLKSRSFAKHIALGELYEQLTALIDEFTEVYQGRYGVIDFGAGSDNVFMQLDDKNQYDAVAFIRQLANYVDTALQHQQQLDSALKNIWDEIIALVYRTKYKLENLS